METDATRMCELLVGLPDVNVIGVGDWPLYLRVVITTRAERPVYPGCGGGVHRHDTDEVELADLPCFGRRTRLVWNKQRWRCPNRRCRVNTFTETDERIAAPAAAITDRAGRWATFQVGRHGRSVAEVADDLGCDWHTVMDAVNVHGAALIDDPDRIGDTTAVGLDEVLFCRLGPFRHRCWSTQIVDVEHGQLLDVVPGRDAAGACGWFNNQDPEWLAGIRWATLDLSGPYRAVFDTMLPHATQIADPFHVIKVLDDGTLIVIESPFVTSLGDLTLAVNPATVDGVGAALAVLHREVSAVRPSAHALRVELTDGELSLGVAAVRCDRLIPEASGRLDKFYCQGVPWGRGRCSSARRRCRCGGGARSDPGLDPRRVD